MHPQSLSGSGSFYRVVSIPELFDTILAFLGKSGCAILMPTSRLVFRSATQVVWKEVNLRLLLFLIPGVTSTNVTGTEHTMHLPSTLDMSRFDTYAPFVKILKATFPWALVLFPQQCGFFSPESPESLLLPNLQHLLITTFGAPDSDRINWILKFLPPSLLSLTMSSINSSQLPRLESMFYRKLVQYLSRHCPRLELLRIFVEEQNPTAENLADPLHINLANTLSLRDLRCNESILHQEGSLQALGRLSRLETLFFITLNPLVFSGSPPLPLAEDSFPALRFLGLQQCELSTFLHLSTFPPLFKQLTKLSINCILHVNGVENGDSSSGEIASAVVMRLAKTSPSLSDLCLSTWVHSGTLKWSLPTLEALAILPLRRLELQYMLDNEYSSWEQFACALPLLEELKMSRQEVSLTQLTIFAARLPNLRKLLISSLNIDMSQETIEANNWEDVVSQGHDQPITLRAHRDIDMPTWCDSSIVSRYLHRIWPLCSWYIGYAGGGHHTVNEAILAEWLKNN